MTQNQAREVELIDCSTENMKVDEKAHPTGSTSDTASSSTVDVIEPYSVDNDAALLQLARQLEYYFSRANLSKDTYVQTLRELNDGYVPISIVSNFAKVQMLVPYEAISAIVLATNDFSSLLEIVAVDTKTGEKVEEESPSTIWAVGPISREPLDYNSKQPSTTMVNLEVAASLSAIGTTDTTNDKSPVQNTIILRDVDNEVTEEQVRALFEEGEQFPSIQSLHLDVANCWFVTLDTTSREDILDVMFQLRSKKLHGDPVKARLKSSARQIDSSSAPPLPILLSPSASMTQLSLYDHSGNANKKKKKKRSKNKNSKKSGSNPAFPRSSMSNSSNINDSGNTILMQPKSNNNNRDPVPTPAEFPALVENKVKLVVVDKDKMDDPVSTRPFSDSASTATTTSSSSLSDTKKQVGCYAAALLKTKPIQVRDRKFKSSKEVNVASKQINAKATSVKADKVDGSKIRRQKDGTKRVPTAAASVVITPPTWGGGRSFADVLRKEEVKSTNNGVPC